MVGIAKMTQSTKDFRRLESYLSAERESIAILARAVATLTESSRFLSDEQRQKLAELAEELVHREQRVCAAERQGVVQPSTGVVRIR